MTLAASFLLPLRQEQSWPQESVRCQRQELTRKANMEFTVWNNKG